MCTWPTAEAAHAASRELVESRLAACVQVLGPVESCYRWGDKLEAAREWVTLVKTTGLRYGDVEAWLNAAHPYEVPEIVAWPIERVNPDYLAWLAASTTDC